MTVHFVQWTLDVRDVTRMARFWSEALGYTVDAGDDGSAKLYPPDEASPSMPTLWLQNTATPKQHKNRNHPDLRPVDGDVDAEVERLLTLGATRVDVGQRADDPFVVLADPEGNEFCVLRRDPRRTD
ncbi:VOC family protein [Egicoccus sp. AB-alg2]|uniref:VOC family protein n=1 Tax=Egicoccus sp. AB-alg2 TaxID=3242693 RepID=UPI00359CD92B